MGYRSEVHIGVAFASADDLKEVVAVYTIDPRVQKLDLLKEWEVKEDNILYYHGDYVKWYDSYEDVQGIEHMLNLVDQFHIDRDIPIAYRFIRLGEDIHDCEERCENGGGGGDDGTLIEKLFDGMSVTRHVEILL
tara:strand:- start:195 stop:599 length:405 start_codon:yes stop_codon:yes gene_type:complete